MFLAFALVEMLYTLSSDIFLFVGFNTIHDTTLLMLHPLTFDQLLILNFLLFYLLIELMVGFFKAFSNILDHLFMLLAIHHICSVSKL